MRSEKEIRAHLDNMRLLLVQPCQCDAEGTAHSFQCRIGGALMRAEIDALKFALGDCGQDGLVERVAKRAAIVRERNAARARKG